MTRNAHLLGTWDLAEFPGGMKGKGKGDRAWKLREASDQKKLGVPLDYLTSHLSQVLGGSQASKCGGTQVGCPPPSLAALGGVRGGGPSPL